MAAGAAYKALNWPTPGFKVLTFEFWVFNRWDLNFCVGSSPPRVKKKKKWGDLENEVK